MTLLLFDLDDTLLGNEMGRFIPAYLQALANRMASVADPTILVKTLLSATRQMVENTRPDRSLEQVFDASFYPRLGFLRQQVQEIIDTFYAQDFPALRALTEFRPQAVEIVEKIIRRGDQAAVATNPLFPRTAISQRLAWAGLPPERIPFALVPSYETFHFAKPNPAYFAEFLAQLGWPKIPVLMVGNDVDSDIRAAQQIGLPVFWLSHDGAVSWNGQESLPPHGELSDLLPWMEASFIEPLQTNFSTSQALLAVLRSTPAALSTLCLGNKEVLGNRPQANEWSPGEVLCHLRDVDAEVNLPRVQKVISEQNPFIAGQETDLWAEARQYCLQDGMQALNDFLASRLDLLHVLESLSPTDWDRNARHAIFGPTHLRELVNIVAGHDILHVQQVYKALYPPELN
ncbi:MAG: DinB family protein [Acidobacteriaceae bacterium]